ncbi:MAG: type I-C CRISPR-associated protein Cas8c/Csd1 [Clostridiales bacterium]|nr:type I-C CRISPR-associated protein Cas8c/Csd1 [Clostridiales bacterium]
MILQSLAALYDRLLADPESDVAPPGYSFAPVTHALELNDDGRVVGVMPLVREAPGGKGKKLVNPQMLLPERYKRTVGVEPNYLSDNSGYVLGHDAKGNPERSAKTHTAFIELHVRLLEGVDDPGAQALLRFLRSWRPEMLDEPLFDIEREAILAGGNLVFFHQDGFLHNRPPLRDAWMHAQGTKEASAEAQCLISGGVGPIAKVHPAIKGVVGAQAVGAALVSFNKPAFTFFGKDQGENAPVSEQAAFAYTTALNHLISSRADERRRTQCMRIGDVTQVFWAETYAPAEEDLLAAWSDPSAAFTEAPADGAQTKSRIDGASQQLMRDALRRLQRGQLLVELHLNEAVRMHLLGLAPNAARLSIRYYCVNTFGELARLVAQHHSDLEIVRGPKDPEFLAPWQILRETAVQGESKNIPPTLGGALMRAIYTGQAYPHNLYAAILIRVRADKAVNRTRAAVIKGYLLRRARLAQHDTKEEAITLALNETWNNPGYLMGRLFALLEKAQVDALGGNVNATIKDRYFGAASATPNTVFPLLLRLSQHHHAKVKGNYIEREIQKVLWMIQVDEAKPLAFPAMLDMDEQGLFMLGYYQQKQALYTKRGAAQDDADPNDTQDEEDEV